MTPSEARSKLEQITREAGDDISFGAFQQTVRYANEGDHTSSIKNIALIERLYSDPVHACDVAARKFKHYRDSEATALDAWCRYNWPARDPQQNPNRGNYADGLEKAKAIMASPATQKVTYNALEPVIAQNDDWSCAPTSARWAMTALGRKPTEGWFEGTMLAEGVVSTREGLLDASGAGLAAFIERHYGEFGYEAANDPSADFSLVAMLAGQAPLLIGSRAWNHWSAVRTYSPERDSLLLANPADGWRGVQQEMTRKQFETLGPFSAVSIFHPDLETDEDDPPAIDPRDEQIADLKRQLDEERTKLGVLQAHYLPTLTDVVKAIGELKAGS